MAFTSMVLTDPASGYSLTLMDEASPVDGAVVTALDVQPSVRAVSEERVGGQGQVDNSMWLSVAAVTIAITIYDGDDPADTPESFLDAIGPLLGPWLRPSLICTNDQWTEQRQMTLRFESKTGPVDNPLYIQLALSFKAPAGMWEAATETVLYANAFVASSGGLPLTTSGLAATPGSGVGIMAGDSSGEPATVDAGNMPVAWTAQLYGPCTAPALANDTAGLTLEFGDGVVLGAGDFVTLDSQARTAVQSSTAASVLGDLNFATSAWWQMQPGTNAIRYYPASAQPGSVAIISFRPGWMP